jgi:hypothetical protein
MADQIDINELRNIFSTSNKKRREADYQKKLTKAQEQKAIKDTVSPPKSPEQLLSEQIQKEKIKKKAESIVNPKSKEEIETKALQQKTALKKARKEAKGSTPQEDMLRFGKKRQEFRNLAYKTSLVQRTDDDNVKEFDPSGKPIKDLVVTELPGNEIFKQQVEAYGDSLKLAGLAQQYGARTPDIRKIDRNRKEIGEERTRIAGEKWKQLMTQKLPMRPGADGAYSEVTDQEKMKMANDIANEELVKKYGKGIIPLLQALKNR